MNLDKICKDFHHWHHNDDFTNLGSNLFNWLIHFAAIALNCPYILKRKSTIRNVYNFCLLSVKIILCKMPRRKKSNESFSADLV